ncbi:MAG: DUF177 domain-containing protein [Candidatus Eisenbacteria bacterium]
MINLDIGSIPEGTSEMDITVDAAELGVSPEDMCFETPVEIRLKADRNGNDIFLKGKAAVRGVLECGRCLEEYSLVLECPIGVWCVIGASGDLTDVGERDSVIEVPAGSKYIDLADHVRSELLIVAPFKPLCSDECKGLCPVCGVDLNVDKCSCERDSNDSRWDALKKIK